MRPHRSASAASRRQPPMPPAQHDVGLDDVEPAAQHEVAGLVCGAHHLPGGEPDVGARPQPRVALEVGRRQRLLQPPHAEALQRGRALRRRGDVPARLAVAGHAPALVRVDHQLEVGADGVAHRLDDLHVAAPVGVVEADLHRPHAAVAQRHRACRPLLRRHELAARRVRQQAVGAAAEELPERRVERPADEVPDGDLQDPAAPAVEVDRLDELAHDLGAARVEADHERREHVRVRQVVAAREALRAVVRGHDDERRVLPRAGHRVPGGAERRVEGDAVAARLDARDAHATTPGSTRSTPPRGDRPAPRASSAETRRDGVADRGGARLAVGRLQRGLVARVAGDPDGDQQREVVDLLGGQRAVGDAVQDALGDAELGGAPGQAGELAPVRRQRVLVDDHGDGAHDLAELHDGQEGHVPGPRARQGADDRRVRRRAAPRDHDVDVAAVGRLPRPALADAPVERVTVLRHVALLIA